METNLIKLAKRLLPLGDFTIKFGYEDEYIICDSSSGVLNFTLWEITGVNENRCICMLDCCEVRKREKPF